VQTARQQHHLAGCSLHGFAKLRLPLPPLFSLSSNSRGYEIYFKDTLPEEARKFGLQDSVRKLLNKSGRRVGQPNTTAPAGQLARTTSGVHSSGAAIAFLQRAPGQLPGRLFNPISTVGTAAQPPSTPAVPPGGPWNGNGGVAAGFKWAPGRGQFLPTPVLQRKQSVVSSVLNSSPEDPPAKRMDLRQSFSARMQAQDTSGMGSESNLHPSPAAGEAQAAYPPHQQQRDSMDHSGTNSGSHDEQSSLSHPTSHAGASNKRYNVNLPRPLMRQFELRAAQRPQAPKPPRKDPWRPPGGREWGCMCACREERCGASFPAGQVAAAAIIWHEP
jgi:hypothetical protein